MTRIGFHALACAIIIGLAFFGTRQFPEHRAYVAIALAVLFALIVRVRWKRAPQGKR